MHAKQFKKLLIKYGFLDEKGCPACGLMNFENTILLRPVAKHHLISLKHIFLMSELTLCTSHNNQKMNESCDQNLAQTVNLVQSEIMGHAAPFFNRGDQNGISGNVTISPRLERLIPNIENPQNRFCPSNQHRSPGFVSTNSVNGSIYLPSSNNRIRPLNYANRMAEMGSSSSLEDIVPYHSFGASAVSSSPQQQNNFTHPTINSIPFPPLPPLTTKIWSHIENNVVSPLVVDNFCFAAPNAEDAYMKFRETSANKSTGVDEVAPARRMAYTQNFSKKPAENLPPSTTLASNTANASSSNGNGVLIETTNSRRGKKILGQGIYKK